MNVLDSPEICTGCSACVYSCPENCIIMVANPKGFLYPKINEKDCVDCNICRTICPANNEIIEGHSSRDTVFAVKHKDDKVRLNSSSGGFFTAISDLVIEQSGIVYGAKYDENFNVIHSRAESAKQRDAFRGSKYVQSDIGETFINVKKDLEKGLLVLFSGTPCQVSGLTSFIKKDYVNLVTCDFICHGVPSPGLWKDYIQYIQQKYNSHLSQFSFRDKSRGWEKAYIKKSFRNGQLHLDSILNEPFGNLFCSNLVLRECCYSCRYSNVNRPSDITMGDFWSIGKLDRQFNDEKGVSQVLINTEKGDHHFNLLMTKIYYHSFNLKDCLQPNLIAPTERNRKIKQFWNDYSNHNINYCLIKYKPRYQKLRFVIEKTGLLKLIKHAIRAKGIECLMI